ncbi:WAT1-related protein At1g70260-like [Silene latifolia]|uniref:WAT1-related protein At1g70260-like n=1 Tax=Silene latifolia TaxID=37657 RepID=UPI003D77F05A
MELMLWEDKLCAMVPFVMMFIMEGCTIALTITAKSAMNGGMNQFVFVAYSNALSSVLLLSYSLMFHRDSLKKIFNLKLLSRFFLLGLTGKTKLNISSRSTKIKVIGVIISILGGVMVATYLGPSILHGPLFRPLILRGPRSFFVFIAVTNEWMLGTSMLAASTFSVAIWSSFRCRRSQNFQT